MKNKIAIIFSWLLVLITMLIIFNFSGHSSEKSAEVSEGVVVQILDIVMDKEDITPPVVKKFQFPVRKMAHFSIYMLLGFCMISAFEKTFKIKKWLNAALSVAACCVYAVSDEFHQGFSANRAPRALDVLIDSCGAVTGVLIFLLFIHLYNKYTNKKVGLN